MNALLRFTIENFRSFSERKSLVLINKLESATESSKITYNKVCALYGANSSGKSNLIDGFSQMLYIIINSVKVNDDDELAFDPFLLNDRKNSPTSYEIEFILDDIQYRYGFSNTSEKIISEWLFIIEENEKETPLFIRNEDGIGVNEKAFQEGIDMEERTNDNRLFLSLVAQLGGNLSKSVITYISKSLNTISGLDTEGYQMFSKKMLREDSDVAKSMKEFFISTKLGFSDVTTQILDFDVNAIPSDVPEELKKRLITDLKGKKSLGLFSTHGFYNSEGVRIKDLTFKFSKMESQGTQKLFEISGPIFDTLLKGSVIFIDELDAKMHPLMSQEIVRLFAEEKSNPNGAQLIFTTHDTNLLSSKLLSNNQVWFTEKDDQERSDLYCLNEIKFLDGSKLEGNDNIEHNYIQGRYGAIPYL